MKKQKFLHNKLFLASVITAVVALGSWGVYKYFGDDSLGDGGGPLGASVFFPYQGGTGTGSVPTAGQILIGGSGSVYTLRGTSNSWDFDEFPTAMTVDADTTITAAANALIFTRASVSGIFEVTGDFKFDGDLMPDGADCANDEILKKTGADDWDCATDETGATTKAFGWIDANNSGGTFVSIGSLSFDASHFTFSNTASEGYLRLDWGAGGPASLSEAETITGNWVNTASPWADNEVIDTLTASNYLLLAGGTLTGNLIGTNASFSYGEFTVQASASLFTGSAFGGIDCNDATDKLLWSGGLFTCGTIASTDLPITGTWATTGTWVLGDGGDRIDFATDTWDLAAGIFSGVLGMTGTGVYDFGGASSFEIPNSAGAGTIDAAGEIGVNTSSDSVNFYDGTAERVLRSKTCKTWAYEDPTSINEWGRVYFDDPFTVTDVTAIVSGSNAVGWQMDHGLTGAITTDLFGTNKSASSTFTYTTFSDATLVNGEFLMLSITSASSNIENIDVTVCGRYDP